MTRAEFATCNGGDDKSGRPPPSGPMSFTGTRSNEAPIGSSGIASRTQDCSGLRSCEREEVNFQGRVPPDAGFALLECKLC